MTVPLRLPLPLELLPPSIARFCDPNAPQPARLMAAKGLVPVRGPDQITMLAQLASDEAKNVKEVALRTLRGLPDQLLHPACDAALPAAVFELIVDLFSHSQETLTKIATNAATHDKTVERIAQLAGEGLAERIAINEARMLQAPGIIEALYKNRNTRMSTADRLIELAARNRLELPGIPAFQDHVEALSGQLIPEPSDEPLPQDAVFAQTLAADATAGDGEVYEEDATGAESVKEQFKPLSMQIADMSKAEKLRMAMIGTKAARAILVRDHNKQVSYAAIASPQTTTQEAAEVAKSKDVSQEILRYIGNKKEWVKSAEVKHNLVFNSKCPVGISLKFMSHLRLDELRQLGRSRNVSAQVRSLAAQMIQRKEKNQ
jgi:hypothetical protein